MLRLLMDNIGTIIAGLIILLVIAANIFRLIRNKKRGISSSCGCGCENCNASCGVKAKNQTK